WLWAARIAQAGHPIAAVARRGAIRARAAAPDPSPSHRLTATGPSLSRKGRGRFGVNRLVIGRVVRPSMRKTILVAILAAVVAAGGGVYLGVLRPLFAVSDTVPLTEQALATPDAVLLAGINVKQAAFLERWLIGAP